MNILVVDDDANIRSLIADFLSSRGHTVHATADGHEALDHMESSPVQIVISDICMPALGGCDLMKSIRRRHPLVRVVLMTGHAPPAEGTAAHGADTYMTKPFQLADIVRLVEGNADRRIGDQPFGGTHTG